MRRFFSAPVIVGILVILFLFGCGLVFLRTGMVVVHSPVDFHAPVIIMPYELTVTATPNSANSPEFTATALPSSTPSDVPTTPAQPATPTATDVPFTGMVIKDCPTESLGTHPDSGQPLEFQMYPYVNADGTGDTNVKCFYEVLDVEQDVKIELSPNFVITAADFSHGTYNEDGTLKDACPTGWKCEGVWVATDDFIIPAGTLMNIRVYIREQPAKQRFTETISWTNADGSTGSMAPFACEYVATQGHSMWNIRVPAWAQAQGEVGTIYGFGLPVGNSNRLTCEGYPIDWEPLPGQLTTK